MTAASASQGRPRRRRGSAAQETRARLVSALSWLAGVLPEGPLIRLAELAGSAWYRVAPERAGGFLRAGDPLFVSALSELSPAVSRREPRALADGVRRAVETVNIAGLCDARKRNWYDAEIADAIAGAPKLGVPPRDVAAALAALGF